MTPVRAEAARSTRNAVANEARATSLGTLPVVFPFQRNSATCAFLRQRMNGAYTDRHLTVSHSPLWLCQAETVQHLDAR